MMRPAKSIVLLTIITLLISVALPLTAFAASEVSITVGNQSVSVTNSVKTTTSSKTSDFEKEMDLMKEDMDREFEEAKKAMEEETDSKTPQSETRELRIVRTPTPTKTPTMTPTPRVKRMRTPTPTPTKKPTATPKPSNTPTPTKAVQQTGSEDTKKAYIMNAINDYRRSQGLSTVTTDPYTCAFAKIRAQEITNGFNHDGFSNRIKNNTLPYPNYSQVTENIAMTSDYKRVVTLWINSPGHAENMRRNTPYICVESSGNYYAYEGWRP